MLCEGIDRQSVLFSSLIFRVAELKCAKHFSCSTLIASVQFSLRFMSGANESSGHCLTIFDIFVRLTDCLNVFILIISAVPKLH